MDTFSRPKNTNPTPIILVQEVDLMNMHSNINECAYKACRIGLSKNEESIPDTEVTL